MIYYTGDLHGSAFEVSRFCNRKRLTREDTVILLGDVGANYYGDERDLELKRALRHLKPTILCIHGNHEARPDKIPSYELKEWCGGLVWTEPDFPNLLFAKDGETYIIEGLRHLAIGGAYSVDKFYRLHRGWNWWPDEQPSPEIKDSVEKQIQKRNYRMDIVLSHTCPFKYEPTEAFLPMVDQSTVDASTEEWLDTIEDQLDYKAWFCGHWHLNKRIDKMHFLFHDFESSEQFRERDPLSALPHYCLQLDDYAAVAFTSFSKEYFGTFEDIRSFIGALEQDESFCKSKENLISTFHRYEQGEKQIQHNVAYQKVPFLQQVKVLHTESRQYQTLQWEHLNTWQWPYYIRCTEAHAMHLWIKYQKKYYRCIKVRFTDLEYEELDDQWAPLGDMLWGYPKMLVYKKPTLWNRLAVIEKHFDSLEALQADIAAFAENPDPEFSRFCDDIFGDG